MIRRRSPAFTLIELVLTIAIVSLTATIAISSVSGARAKARDEKRVTDLKQIQKALELSFESASGYPVAASPLAVGTGATDVLCSKGPVVAFVPDQGTSNCDVDGVYMGLVPSNPTPNGSDYVYSSTDGNVTACTVGPCLGYCLETTLERGLPQIGLAAGSVIADHTSLRNGTCP